MRSDKKRWGLVLVLSAILSFAVLAISAGAQAIPLTGTTAPPINGVHVSGNHLVDSAGHIIRLHGVNRSGSEYICTSPSADPFDGPHDQASIDAIRSWGSNAVRVPLNEDCWLGINSLPVGMSVTAYRSEVEDFVSLLSSNGLAVIVELHWSAPGSTQATGQQPMPDADHSPAFWTSVANVFKGNPNVLLDLYNEPYPENWTCLRDGGTCSGVPFQAAGMQSLVNTVRATGASNVIMVGGIGGAGDLSQWLSFKPTDPQNAIVASWHNYNFSACNNQSCWESTVAPVAASVPLVTGEIGENDCAHGYVDSLMAWLDGKGASYLAWAWDVYDCGAFPSLVSSYDGTATNYGAGVKAHYLALIGSTPTPTPTATPVRTATPTATPVCRHPRINPRC